MALEDRLLLSAYTVLNTNDSGTGSLRDAVNQANTDGGANTITFDPTSFATAKTITLSTGQIDLNDVGGLTITAPSVGVTISGNSASRVFQLDAHATASLTGLTITGGHSGSSGGGLSLNNNSTETITNCTISGNSADVGGGHLR